MSKRTGAALCLLGALCWMLAGLAGTVVGFLTSEGRFERALLRQVPWEALGIPQEELRAFAGETMRYFRGETDRWEPEVTAASGPIVISEAFTRHMETVRNGIRTARALAIAGAVLGAALMAFLGAELKSGIEIVTTALNLEEHIHDCTLVITGEGRIDSQSIHGKVPIGVANVAKKYHKPVIGIAGSLTNDVGVVHQHGIDAVFSVLTSIGTLDEALRGAYDNICRASRNIAATLAIGMRNAG